MNSKRIRGLNTKTTSVKGPILYWTERDQRLHDNWALLHAQNLALKAGTPLGIVYILSERFLDCTWRHYFFILQGLKELELACKAKGIAFFLLLGEPDEVLPAFVESKGIAHVVTDFSPLKKPREWREKIAEKIAVPMDEVDAHNIVPCWLASNKQEFGAYTLRPKLHRMLPEFLDDFPELKKHPHAWESPEVDFAAAEAFAKVDRSVGPAPHFTPGEKAAHKALKYFLSEVLPNYAEGRNDPNQKALSNLSPYFHFGQLSPQRVALLTQDHESFFEELVVRRELSDNFCFYNPHYDSTQGFANWAKETHAVHRQDPRDYLYSEEELEKAQTHDPLWNAGQNQMVQEGKMHGYLRMYWAKKILEWTSSPEEALRIALKLNDKYELDGNDPNGYVGCAWSIGGVHDRAWFERPVFGKIRYMNFNGCKRKFDVNAYINQNTLL